MVLLSIYPKIAVLVKKDEMKINTKWHQIRFKQILEKDNIVEGKEHGSGKEEMMSYTLLQAG